MSILRARLRLPLFQAPMFLQSGPERVVAASQSGIIGSFPSPNARSGEQLESWLKQITAALNPEVDAPWSINLMMHRSNPRRLDELCAYLLDRGVAKFKLPERIHYVTALPRNPMGKVVRAYLQALLVTDEENI